jgi:hypothetical protein
MTQSARPHTDPEPIDSVDVSATRSADGETVVVSGTALDSTPWEYTLTKRAARSLWFDLTRLLYPEKSDQVIAQMTTMPSMPRFDSAPSALTSWVFVSQGPDGCGIINGWNGYPGWTVRLNAYEIYRFWASLDVALFPTGW